MAVEITPQYVFTWVALAFALWLLLLAAFDHLRLNQAAVVAAVLSWLAAGAVMWTLPLLLHWISP